LGESYVQLNALLSAMAWNMKKWMQKAISRLLEKWLDRVFTCRINFAFLVAWHPIGSSSGTTIYMHLHYEDIVKEMLVKWVV
jgi:hypothetical protein